jgi:TPR repeat protein
VWPWGSVSEVARAAEAVVWFRKAADQGIPGAQFDLGEAYEKGMGVPQDNGQAALWYRKAAEQGHAEARAALNRVMGLGLTAPVVADPAPSPALDAANALIDEAKRCSESSAEQYAKVVGETAETIAAAAFDKCEELWKTATNKLIDALLANFRKKFSQKDYADPISLNEILRVEGSIFDQNRLEVRREAEIRRLRVLVLDLRSEVPSH